MATNSCGGCSPSERRPLRVGLTGGIGSGKSLVADLLAARGAVVIDTDAIAHRLTAAGGRAIGPIVEAFGAQVLDRQGALDRPRMRSLVFGDPAAKARLERILHPWIGDEAEREAEAAAACASYLVFVVPLLVESGAWAARVDRVLVVDCPVELQIERVVRSRGLERAQVEAIVAQQAARDRRLEAADDIVFNAEAVASVAARVERLHKHYLRLAALRGGRSAVIS